LIIFTHNDNVRDLPTYHQKIEHTEDKGQLEIP